MSVSNSFQNMARPSGMISRQMSDAERLAISTEELSLIADPAERAVQFPGLVLLDRIGNRPITPAGNVAPTPAVVNNQPAVQGYEAASCLLAPYQLASSYTIFAAFETGPVIGQNDAMACSLDQANANRQFFGVRLGDRLGIVHGAAYAISTPEASILPSTKYVVWGGFNAENVPVNNAVTIELGINSPSTLASGRSPTLHMGDTQTALFGGMSDRGSPHKGVLIGIAPRFLGGEANYLRRAAIMAWFAERIGIPLAA